MARYSKTEDIDYLLEAYRDYIPGEYIKKKRGVDSIEINIKPDGKWQDVVVASSDGTRREYTIPIVGMAPSNDFYYDLEIGGFTPREGPVKSTATPKRRSEQMYLVQYPRNNGSSRESGEFICGPISFTNARELLASFFLQSYYNYRKSKNWRKDCIGLFNAIITPEGEHRYIPMFDYDGKNMKRRIRQDVKTLQDEHNLGNAWVYKTRRGYHVYFFNDYTEWPAYLAMLDKTKCCKAFRNSTIAKGGATLRISAKYTSFDIKLEYVLPSANNRNQRPGKVFYAIQQIISLGQECGTHVASLFPQWAHYQEDDSEWNSPRTTLVSGGRKVRRIKRKSKSPGDLIMDAKKVEGKLEQAASKYMGFEYTMSPQIEKGEGSTYSIATPGVPKNPVTKLNFGTNYGAQYRDKDGEEYSYDSAGNMVYKNKLEQPGATVTYTTTGPGMMYNWGANGCAYKQNPCAEPVLPGPGATGTPIAAPVTSVEDEWLEDEDEDEDKGTLSI